MEKPEIEHQDGALSVETTAESIFANYETAATFTITLKRGEKLTCTMPSDVADVAAIEKRAAQMHKMTEKNPPKPWRPFLPITPEVARMVCYLSLVQSPKFTDVDGLRMAKHFGPVLLHIFNEIMAQVGSAVAENEKEQTDDFLDV